MIFHDSNFSPAEAALLERASTWKQSATLEELSAKALCQITLDEGIDFATALLFDRFRKFERRASFIQRIDTLRRFPPTQIADKTRRAHHHRSWRSLPGTS